MTRISLYQCIMICFDNKELMDAYRRLRGSSFGLPRDALVAAIDEACGRPAVDTKEADEFFTFVKEYVWWRLDPAEREECS